MVVRHDAGPASVQVKGLDQLLRRGFCRRCGKGQLTAKCRFILCYYRNLAKRAGDCFRLAVNHIDAGGGE